MAGNLTLFPFQEEAAVALRTAALDWMEKAAADGPPKWGETVIPFLGQLRAVTGSGKTPILARVVAELGPAVVIWTSKSSAVVEQTETNLRHKYRHLLPNTGVEVLRGIPSHGAWRQLLESKTGLTIWVLTVASWNEAEQAGGKGSVEARLNLHRPQPDWAGDQSPWDQLRHGLARPLWIVSDESHNQSSAQLDQLVALRPKGFLMASATPVMNDRFGEWAKALAPSSWAPLLKAATVPVRTRDVVEADLLKTTIEVIDFNSGFEESLDGALAAYAQLLGAIDHEGAPLMPRCIYAVEQSNQARNANSVSRPTAIWSYLRSRGVAADEIAVFTETRDLPEEAQRLTSIAKLLPRHRHIIFNQSLQEGWDDPEAYVCYFDGVTNSFLRIRQILGRVLRQPAARRYHAERLNTATIILNAPTETFDAVISDLRAELRLYAPDGEPDFVPIRVKTRKEPLPAVPLKATLAGVFELPRMALKAPKMKPVVDKIVSRGSSPWPASALDHRGTGKLSVVSLESDNKDRREFIEVMRSARTANGLYLRRQIQQRNRACLIAIHPDEFKGAAYEQLSCQGSTAQSELSDLSETTVAWFEDRVDFQQDPDPDRATWTLDEYRPRGREMIDFANAAHARYSVNDFNQDELAFARAIDKQNVGVWVRNSASSDVGFSLPLPAKVGDSTRFYPDFLWWVGKTCWAIDTTGRHLLDDKVKGKLLSCETPRIALVVRGKINITSGLREGQDGWSLLLARPTLKPLVEHHEGLDALLQQLVQQSS